MSMRHQVAITMALGALLIAVVLIVTLARSPPVIISTNYTTVTRELAHFISHTTVCQPTERLPPSTAALRISLVSQVGPAVFLTVSHEGQVVARGHHDGGWASSTLTLPLEPPPERPLDVKICLTRDPGGTPVELTGQATSSARATTVDGRALPGRLRVEYLGRGHSSWLSQATHVARRLGLSHTPSGTWIALPVVALVLTAVGLGAWLLMREAST
jgi:hypothetical protein